MTVMSLLSGSWEETVIGSIETDSSGVVEGSTINKSFLTHNPCVKFN